MLFNACYICGQEGHVRATCPSRSKIPLAAPGLAPAPKYTMPALLPAPYQPSPPTPEYLAVRSDLGMPSHTAYILRQCPWCGAAAMDQCVNRALGTVRPPHEMRVAGIVGPPHNERLRLAAAQQVAESRAARA